MTPGRKQRPGSWGHDAGDPAEIPGTWAHGGSCWWVSGGQHYIQDPLPPPKTKTKSYLGSLSSTWRNFVISRGCPLLDRQPLDPHETPICFLLHFSCPEFLSFDADPQVNMTHGNLQNQQQDPGWDNHHTTPMLSESRRPLIQGRHAHQEPHTSPRQSSPRPCPHNH